MTKNEKDPFDQFAEKVRALVDKKASEKGYNKTGPHGSNELLDFVNTIAPDFGHPIGEMIYKSVRYSSRREKDDLLKIAAWAFLIWHHDNA